MYTAPVSTGNRLRALASDDDDDDDDDVWQSRRTVGLSRSESDLAASLLRVHAVDSANSTVTFPDAQHAHF